MKTVIELLLKGGADLMIGGGVHAIILFQRASLARELPGGPYGNASQAAALSGNFKPVQFLLNHGADRETGGGGKWKTPSQAAVYRAAEKQVET